MNKWPNKPPTRAPIVKRGINKPPVVPEDEDKEIRTTLNKSNKATEPAPKTKAPFSSNITNFLIRELPPPKTSVKNTPMIPTERKAISNFTIGFILNLA